MNPQTKWLALVPAVLAACTTVEGDGELTTEPRSAGEFTTLEVEGTVEVEVMALRDDHAVEVTCDANLQQYILTEVKGGALVIREQARVKIEPTGICVVAISLPTLRALSVSGTADVSGRDLEGLRELRSSGTAFVDVRGIESDEFELYMSGDGDLQVAGDTDQLRLDSAGSGMVDARALDAVDAVVRASGSGDVWLSVSGTLDARVSGSGDVEVYGDPSGLRTDATGSGDITIH
jgi:hypothetical protein